MKHLKSGYSKSFLLPSGEWEKIWHEVENEEGDDPRKSLYEARRIVNNFHFESNKAAEKQIAEAPQPKGDLMADIASCDSVKTLEAYKLIVRNKPDLQAIYDKRHSELQNNTQ